MPAFNFPATFNSCRQKVCILGLGFVGAAMAVAVSNAKNGKQPLYDVIGVDLANAAGLQRISAINAGNFPFENTDAALNAAMQRAREQGNLFATHDNRLIACADYVVMDINLDIQYDNKQEPCLDLSAFRKAVYDIGMHIKPGALIIVETTVPPGTCEKVVRPIIQECLRKRNIDSEPHIAHSYERVMPGKDYYNSIINFWRVYSGIDELSASKCEQFLQSVINTDEYPLTRLQSTSATETAKVLENSYRATTIAFMEEWGRFAEQIGIDLFEVIDAIRMRPTHSNMRQPGFGVGGYCLTKDPYFAKLAARDFYHIEGLDFPFCTQAVRLNNKMPLVSLDAVERELGGLSGKRILLLGVSYRQDVGDTRYSPSQIFVEEALRRGATIVYQDPLVEFWEEMGAEVLQDYPAVSGFDAIVFAVSHKEYCDIDFTSWLSGAKPLIFDANNVLPLSQRKTIAACGCIIKSIGRS